MNFFEKIEDRIIRHREHKNERRAERALRHGHVGRAMEYEDRAVREDMRRNGLEERAEMRAESRARRDLRRGDVDDYMRQQDRIAKTERLREVENLAADYNDPIGEIAQTRPFGPARVPLGAARIPVPSAPPMPLGTRPYAENRTGAMLEAEVQAERLSNLDAVTGDFLGAAFEDRRGRRLDRARNAEEILEEELVEQRAINDLAMGDEAGYMCEKMRAMRIKERQQEENLIADVNRDRLPFYDPRTGYA